jgi:hypothetical protein
MMARNPILEEIYAAREKLLADYNGDFHAYVESARQRALASGKRIVSPKDGTERSSPAAQPPPQKQA